MASREIFDAIRIPLAVCDPVTGTILSANDAFTRDFGFELERPGTLTLSAIGAAQQTPLLSTRLARTLGGAPQDFPWIVRAENGAEHPVELSLTVVQEEGTRRVLAQFRLIGGHDHGGTEHNFSEAVINSVPGAFYLIDPNGQMVRWNSITERMSVQHGQLRHLPGGVYWEEGWERDTYQNGGYLGDPHRVVRLHAGPG